ncbi:MAG: hypothetical protein CMM94_01550, partial [Rickettsiales bacterium]|nr:hypothetical protein [Rickettsiales bacterium]
IEEQVPTGLEEMLEQYEPAQRLEDTYDTLHERYIIHVGEALPHLNSGTAKAYKATDQQQTDRVAYALIVPHSIPYRADTANALTNVDHPNMVALYDKGPVRLSNMGEACMCFIFQQPVGQQLSQIIQKGPMHEHEAVDKYLLPLAEALAFLREKGVVHGTLNPQNIFVGDKIMLGECISEPCGYSQPFIYEPIERALCEPMGKGVGDRKADAYAFGVIGYELIYGLDTLRSMPQDKYLRTLMDHGSYHLFSHKREFSELFDDLFRGTLVENNPERWNTEQIAQWAHGKRFNLIHPAAPRESSRPVTVDEKDYFNRRALANGIQKNWRQAGKHLRASKLGRWLEMSTRDNDAAEMVGRMIDTISLTDTKIISETLGRIIAVLDPYGPMRYRDIACHVDGLGPLVAHYYKEGRHEELQHIITMIQNDLPSFWVERSEEPRSPEINDALWHLQKVRPTLNLKSLGFGMERLLYELNPELPCQSDLVKAYYVQDIPTLLTTLDALAPRLAKSHPLIDRHIAAFITTRLKTAKEIKVREIEALSSLRGNQELVCMKIMAHAQDKQKKASLPGLAAWVGLRVADLADRIHNRRIRKKIRMQLKAAASLGHIASVLATLLKREVADTDEHGFNRAAQLYRYNDQKINLMKSPKTIDQMANDLGARMAVFMAYTILGVTFFVLVNQYDELFF